MTSMEKPNKTNGITQTSPHLPEEVRQRIKALCLQYEQVFLNEK